MQKYQPHHPILVVGVVDLMEPWQLMRHRLISLVMVPMVQDLEQLPLHHNFQNNLILGTYDTPR